MTTYTATADNGETVSYSDSRRYLWMLGMIVPVLPLVGWGLVEATGLGVFWYFSLLFVYGVLPFLDMIFDTDENNPPEAVVPTLSEDSYYRWILYLYIPLYYGTFIWGAWMIATAGLPWWAALGITLSVGGVSGVAINTAHELGHKTGTAERWLAKITLAPLAYGHFFVEHNRGHHKRVATPEDPASSRMGENLYAFLPRTIFGSLRSAWTIEKERLARRGKSVWSIENDNLNAWAMTLVLWGGLIALLGWIIVPFLLIQAVYGFSLLEVVNYLEHYGLRRQKLDNGRYERCQPHHSWNSNHIVTNLFLYQLQRHSDHHANPTRHYQALREFPDAPQLPSGYAAMLLIAYVPPLWSWMMDKRVAEHHNYDLTKAALQPGKEAKLMDKWHRAVETPAAAAA
ncbi:alkane 1-monooxygenase [bacterium]|nr:alkane 1-monooxygenase [bacterium]